MMADLLTEGIKQVSKVMEWCSSAVGVDLAVCSTASGGVISRIVAGRLVRPLTEDLDWLTDGAERRTLAGLLVPARVDHRVKPASDAHAQYSRAPAARLMQCTGQCWIKTRMPVIAASWVDWLAYGLTALSTHNYEGHIAPLVKSRKHLNHTLIKILHTDWYIMIYLLFYVFLCFM